MEGTEADRAEAAMMLQDAHDGPTPADQVYMVHRGRLEARIAGLVAERRIAVEALQHITRQEGRYSPDNQQHAVNTIEDMAQLATDALAQLAPRPGGEQETP
jgi:propanediol dehydratase large subunit